MTELTRTINNVNDLSTAQSDITSLQESVNTNTTNITTLQDELVVSGSNLSVGGDWLANYTSSTQGCTAVGYQAMQKATTG